ncbi:amidohydrolase family protein [Paenibacillus kobensis]|uniref:amidohydrolase family protein n=1 Tax=Paenibacillus kobensis TaxID=59841 RepID=UPI000FD70C29|nr:amidohydrolase family protein [Paenibacillus kobensis]
MPHQFLRITVSALSAASLVLAGCSASSSTGSKTETVAAITETAGREVIVEPMTDYAPDQDAATQVEAMRANKKPGQELYEAYRDLTVIDIHNHAAANPNALSEWGAYGIDRIVLFGDISEPSAQTTDRMAWEQYQKEPSHVYPSFAGFPLYEDEGIAVVEKNLEKGYLNIGEVAAASTYSPIVSKVKWKSKHPNDGNWPAIYDLAAKYKVPVLLHIDPPNGEPIVHLEEALDEHPDTVIIFGHANAYNPPSNIEALLEKHPNLYIDFFAGFTAYSNDSTNKLEDFVPLIEKYPDRFMLSTDSGYGLTTDTAAKGLYDIIDLLKPETAAKVAYQNYERLVELQPPTGTQIQTIKTLSAQAGKYETYRLNKRMANELIFELTALTDK